MTDSITILGVDFDSQGKGEGNWRAKVPQVARTLGLWSLRDFSFEGRFFFFFAFCFDPLFILPICFIPAPPEGADHPCQEACFFWRPNPQPLATDNI